MAGCLPDIEALAPDDLKGLVLQLLEDVVALKAENAALREEIARLKGLKGPPKLKPSGMEKATEPARAERKAGRRGGKIDRLVIDEERVLKAAVPPGVNGGGIMLHARRPGGPVAAAQNCATHGPLSVATRGRRCTAWSSMRRFDWRLSTRV